MKKKVVVTGALGHIGSAFVHSMKPQEYAKVVMVDDMSAQRYCSLFNLPADVPYKFIEADIDSADLAELFQDADAVVHFAAITDAASSFENASEVERVNYNATCKVAQACAASGARLIFPSTTSVYGVQDQVVDETCPLDQLKPQSPYAESKLRSEQMLAEIDGLKYVIIRMGTIFGTSPGMRFHTAVNKFIWQACMGQPLTVWRSAMNQKRPYLSVSDAVRALRFVLEHDLFDGNIYNILTMNATVGEIVDSIREFVPDTQVELVDARIMNQLSYDVSSALFRSLGFEFEGQLRNDVEASVAQLRNARAVVV